MGTQLSLDGEVVHVTPLYGYPVPPPVPGRYVPKFNGNGQYRLPDPVSGKMTSYTRASTVAKTLEDTNMLDSWAKRMMLIGIQGSIPLAADLDQLITEHLANGGNEATMAKDLRSPLNSLSETAQERAGAGRGAEFGTAVHAWCEWVDIKAGYLWEVPEMFRPWVTAHRRILADNAVRVHPEWTERVVLNTQFGIAGTIDRLYWCPDMNMRLGDIKGLALDTPIPTPTGWTTMAAVRVGDHVLGSDGRPARVTVKSDTKNIGTYIVRFDDGSSVVCDSEHIWSTTTRSERSRGCAPTPKPISEIISTLRTNHNRGQRQHWVQVAEPLKLPDADLPVDPYLLGTWLGDGTATTGGITKGPDLFDILTADGHVLGKPQTKPSAKCSTRTVFGLRTQLRAADLLGNKHIPAAYLRASIPQRLLLLQGLMDTDGTWNIARNSAVFNSTDKALAHQVHELICTLGQRPHIASVETSGFGSRVTSWAVQFTPVNIMPFRLPRKIAKVVYVSPARSSRRLITAIEPGPDVPTACIGVDSPDHTYLCGEGMIPTHNTSKGLDFSWLYFAIQLAIYHGAQYVLSLDGTTWEPMPYLMPDVALISHLPRENPDSASIVPIDMDFGRTALHTAVTVRKLRSRAEKEVQPVRYALGSEDITEKRWHAAYFAIETSRTEPEMAAVWDEYQDVWTPELTDLGRALLASVHNTDTTPKETT